VDGVALGGGACERSGVSMETSDPAVAAVAEDFGHVLRGSPAGLVRPRSPAEVAEVVREAVSSGSRLTLRGLGHSAGGQALPSGSVAVDLSGLDAIGPVDRERQTIHCQAGALLRPVVVVALEQGLLPRALTNLLDLTVGGLLSVGGIGPGSHRYGPILANAAELEVVTADGQLHTCSAAAGRQLHEAVLGGLGRCGVIVSAQLRLRLVRPRVRTFYLLYDDHRRWIDDQRTLARTASVSAMEGFCSASMQGLRGTGGRRAAFAQWFFPLQVSFEFDEATPDLPAGLSPCRVLGVEDDEIACFPARHDLRIEAIRRPGAWERPHPYIGALIGADALAGVLPQVLEAPPLSLGHGHCGTFFMATGGLPPVMALPAAGDVVFFAIMYPQILPQFLDASLEAFGRIAGLLTGAGGKRYLADWLGDMSEQDWRRHWGTSYDHWLECKRTFDPKGVFCPLLLP
jgi:cytokinin dehydrogenase